MFVASALSMCVTVAFAALPAPLALSPQQVKRACAAAPYFAGHPLVLVAIAHKESRFQWDARGSSGECGMTQVLPSSGGVKCQWLDQPDVAANTASRVLARWTRRARGNLFHGLAAYNAGTVGLLRDCDGHKRCERGHAYAFDVLAIMDAYALTAGAAKVIERTAKLQTRLQTSAR